MNYRKNNNFVFKKGDLVEVTGPQKDCDTKLCVVVSISIPCYYKVNDFFMVYSISERQKFVTNYKFMKKIH